MIRAAFIGLISHFLTVLFWLAGSIAVGEDAGSGPGNEHGLADIPLDIQSAMAPSDRGRPIASLKHGFAQGSYRTGLALGHGTGPSWLGSKERHDLFLTSLQLGWMVTGVLGREHFYAGNLELVAEMMGGWQYHPRDAYLAGLTPMVRYNLVIGSRWVPFIEAGAGLVVTDIRHPDLGTDLSFHSLGGMGLLYRLSECSALALETRFGHISNAGIAEPNNGVNEFVLLFGWSRHW